MGAHSVNPVPSANTPLPGALRGIHERATNRAALRVRLRSLAGTAGELRAATAGGACLFRSEGDGRRAQH